MPDLMYPENASFLFDRDQPLVNEWDIRYNIRAMISEFEMSLIIILVGYFRMFLFWGSTLGAIRLIIEAFAHILRGEFVFQAVGLIIIMLFVLNLALRFAIVSTIGVLLVTWFALDKNSEDRIYSYLTKHGKLSPGRVTGVANSYESPGVYLAYKSWKDIRYFTKNLPRSGVQWWFCIAGLLRC